jgi:hypothetical protein
LTRQDGLEASDRVRGEATRVNNERCRACSSLTVRVDPMEGVLVRPVVVVLNRRRQRRTWRGRCAGDAGGARVLFPSPRQRAPEARWYGQASSADGRRRSAAAVDRDWVHHVISVPRRCRGVQATTVKSRATRRRATTARTVDPSTRTDDERRCRTAPQAPCGGSRRPKGRWGARGGRGGKKGTFLGGGGGEPKSPRR